ncbi:hypothetical protein RDWZM_002289 [Blomia tropicalis]|uniref:Uncharacterized protein n=1 Tax=Blomia tropicalis TaxID=40697 RepID=A0A9Q0ME33_BLOTA|nr:hypothetical protein BLOT_002006 [Blomia tropicalis]KAJ6223744.1 hypothetical protein RDWZM_002289 [Blomia tropicalis]
MSRIGCILIVLFALVVAIQCAFPSRFMFRGRHRKSRSIREKNGLPNEFQFGNGGNDGPGNNGPFGLMKRKLMKYELERKPNFPMGFPINDDVQCMNGERRCNPFRDYSRPSYKNYLKRLIHRRGLPPMPIMEEVIIVRRIPIMISKLLISAQVKPDEAVNGDGIPPQRPIPPPEAASPSFTNYDQNTDKSDKQNDGDVSLDDNEYKKKSIDGEIVPVAAATTAGKNYNLENNEKVFDEKVKKLKSFEKNKNGLKEILEKPDENED